MTPSQLERAARHYCKLMGEDPDHPAYLPREYSVRWRVEAWKLKEAWAMNEALKEGMWDQVPKLRIVHKDETYDDLVGKPGQIIPLKDGDRAIWVSDTTDA